VGEPKTDNASSPVRESKGADRSRSPLPEFEFEQQESIHFDGRFMRPGDLVDHPNPAMPLLDAICTRRTSRVYSECPVDRATFDWLVAQAMHAPTACNEQQWKIVVIDDPEVVQDLYRRGSAAFLQNARQCFLICYNRRGDNVHWLDHVQSGAAFITTFQLLAHSIGVGSCWIGHLPNKSELRRLFGIHRAYDPVALVSYGYYRSRVKIIPRKHSATRIIMENQFSSEGLVFSSHRQALVRSVVRWVYYKVPAVIRRRIRDWSKPHEKKFYYENFD